MNSNINGKLKLDADVIAKIFSPIRQKMKIPDFYTTDYGMTKYKLNNSWEDALRDGIEITGGDPDFSYDSDSGELLYRGVKVLLYIRDQTNYKLKNVDLTKHKSTYKFHVAYCQTLESMYQQGKYEKYVVSTRTDGIFFVRLSNGRDEVTSEQELKVCKNCLKRLNYKNYNNLPYPKQREIYNKFSLDDFFSVNNGDYRFLGTLPRNTDKNAPVNAYTNDWQEISERERERHNWKCEVCGKDCSENHSELQVHHKNGIKSDNSPYNLITLCIDCHSKEHAHMKNLKHKKQEQNLFDF